MKQFSINKALPVALTALLTVAVAPSYAADPVTPPPTRLSAAEQEMLAWIDQRRDNMLSELKTHVDINTGTDNIEGIDRYRQLLAEDLRQLGFKTREYHSNPQAVLSCSGGSVAVADHLVASRTGDKPNRILLNGHMDTVFSPGDNFQSLTIMADGTLHGPGVADMKGGIVIMLNALRALDAAGRLEGANITVLFNSDEETGSLGSRPLVEKLARQHDVGFVFEGSENNRLTHARKGLGQARLKITGREAHAGANHEEGVSANLELAHKIVEIEKLTDYERNITVNVGVMRGGEKRNTIPGCADAFIDLRYPTAEEGQFLVSSIEGIAASPSLSSPHYPRYPQLAVWTSLHRPVKPATPQVDALIAEAVSLSQLIGEPITGTRYSGGGTDGSISQAVGLPTLDSTGMDGTGVHSSREKTSVASLMARTKLAAVMLGRQIDRAP